MRASVKHNLDPLILAAVGEQESGMGKGADYDPVTKLGRDGTGHGMWQMDESAHSMADCLRLTTISYRTRPPPSTVRWEERRSR